ncbi:MAG: sterol desaturase family protein [Azospirillum sp.]|nr:sterol desaturase family protein [Azospirillum sp.]
MPDLPIIALLSWKTTVVAGGLALLFLAERLLPAAPWPSGDRFPGGARVLRNGALWLLNAGLSPLVVLPVTAWAATVAPGWRPAWWSGGAGLACDLVLLDCWLYWWHRANHELPLLWRFHQVHHLDPFLDSTSALRFHFGEVLLSAGVRALVIAVLAMPLSSVLVFETLVLLGALFHHSNLRLAPGVEKLLSRLVVTPSIHWVHHHAVRRDTDSNYATLFSLWDLLFGSRSPTRREAAMPIGIENQREPALPGLLLLPFRRRRRISPAG